MNTCKESYHHCHPDETFRKAVVRIATWTHAREADLSLTDILHSIMNSILAVTLARSLSGSLANRLAGALAGSLDGYLASTLAGTLAVALVGILSGISVGTCGEIPIGGLASWLADSLSGDLLRRLFGRMGCYFRLNVVAEVKTVRRRAD